MSKDDFRDRLKSYSSEPDHGEWIKMQQLLDADKDNRKPFTWWRFGVLLALVLVPASLLLAFYSSDNGDKEEHIVNSNFSVASIIDTQPDDNNALTSVTKQINLDGQQDKSGLQKDEKSTDDSDINKSPEKSGDRIAIKSIEENNTGSTKSTTNKIKNSIKEVLKSNTQKAKQSDAILSRPQANVSSQLNTTSPLPKTIIAQEPKMLDLSDNMIADLNVLDNIDPSGFNLEEREMPELDYVPFTKVYDTPKSNPWYLVSGVGVKYPIVDISNAEVGSLVPTQKFFPSYLAEVGVGKHFGKFSVEGGAVASLYQYKLGKVFNEESLQWGTSQNGTNSDPYPGEDIYALEQGDATFIINKFAVVSPYLRAQYSFNLKRRFILGLHSMINFNRKINLPNQVVSDQFAFDTRNDPVQLNETLTQVKNGKKANINLDLGFSLEKLLAKRGRFAIDFSYSFATDVLEQGRYSVLRETAAETNGVYSISGMGPKVKFRYYLNSGT